jgi:hypothetical protein
LQLKHCHHAKNITSTLSQQKAWENKSEIWVLARIMGMEGKHTFFTRMYELNRQNAKPNEAYVNEIFQKMQ